MVAGSFNSCYVRFFCILQFACSFTFGVVLVGFVVFLLACGVGCCYGLILLCIGKIWLFGLFVCRF